MDYSKIMLEAIGHEGVALERIQTQVPDDTVSADDSAAASALTALLYGPYDWYAAELHTVLSGGEVEAKDDDAPAVGVKDEFVYLCCATEAPNEQESREVCGHAV